MDNLTHTAVGLFLSRIGLGRWSPSATAIVLIAANIPDIDVVAAAGGPLNYLLYHRNLTHSIAMMPVMALASVAIVRLVWRKPINWAWAFFAALIAVGSHLVLDWTNVYGIRLLLPFSGRWLRADTTAVIDLCIWAIVLIGIAGPFLARLVGSEISSGSIKERHHGRGFAWFALLMLLLYDCSRGVLHARAVASWNLACTRLRPVARRRHAGPGHPFNGATWSRKPPVLTSSKTSTWPRIRVNAPPLSFTSRTPNRQSRRRGGPPPSRHSCPSHNTRCGASRLTPPWKTESCRGLRPAFRHSDVARICSQGRGDSSMRVLESSFQFGASAAPDRANRSSA